MSTWTKIRKKIFGGGHSSGPKVEKAPEAKLQTVEQDKALSTMKSEKGMLSTLLGGGKSYLDKRPTTNAYVMTGNEYANNKAEFLATNTVKEKDYGKGALKAVALGAAANPTVFGTSSLLTGGAGQAIGKLGLNSIVPGASMLTSGAGMLLGGPAAYYGVKAIDSLTHGAVSKTLNSAIKDVKNIGAKLGIGHRHDTKKELERQRQRIATNIENTATQATQFSDDTQGTTKKYKKQTTSEFLGM